MSQINKIGIFYFSGTGNTRIIAKLYCDEFNKSDMRVKINPIENLTKNLIKINPNNYAIIGLGYPVHAFSAPSIVYDFIKSFPVIMQKKKVFLFKSMGDPLFYGGSTHVIRKLLRKKGYDVFHEDFLVMPSNVILDYDNRLKRQLFNVAKRKIAIYSSEILKEKRKLQPNPGFLKIMSSMFSLMESCGAKFFGKFLFATDGCNECKICVKGCPTNNIEVVNGNLRFGFDCVFCLRCVYTCPQNAIKNKIMNIFILKRGYNFNKVIENDDFPSEFITETTKGYFKHFYKYLNNELYT